MTPDRHDAAIQQKKREIREDMYETVNRMESRGDVDPGAAMDLRRAIRDDETDKLRFLLHQEVDLTPVVRTSDVILSLVALGIGLGIGVLL